ETIQHRHVDIHHQHIGLEAFNAIYCLLAIACHTDNLYLFVHAQQQPKGHSHLRMIIGDRNADHGIPELFSAVQEETCTMWHQSTAPLQTTWSMVALIKMRECVYSCILL